MVIHGPGRDGWPVVPGGEVFPYATCPGVGRRSSTGHDLRMVRHPVRGDGRRFPTGHGFRLVRAYEWSRAFGRGADRNSDLPAGGKIHAPLAVGQTVDMKSTDLLTKES